MHLEKARVNFRQVGDPEPNVLVADHFHSRLKRGVNGLARKNPRKAQKHVSSREVVQRKHGNLYAVYAEYGESLEIVTG